MSDTDPLAGCYWHLATRERVLLHNIQLGRGRWLSASALAMEVPGAVSLYQATAIDVDKEGVWEALRIREFPHLPSRMGAFFLFDDEATANEMAARWFASEERILLRVQVYQSTVLHRADARWLDGHRQSWEENARRYWSGEMSEKPVPEVVAHGALFFPDWERLPPSQLWNSGHQSQHPKAHRP